MEAGQPAQLTGTNRSNALDPDALLRRKWRAVPAGKPPACSGKTRPRPPQRRFFTSTHTQPPTDNRPGTPGTTPRDNPRGPGQPGGHGEGPSTRSHPELGRENPQRRWYCRSSGGRVGRRQARPVPRIALTRPATRSRPGRAWPPPEGPPSAAAGWKSPVARQAHNRCETRRTQCGVERSAALVEQRPRAGAGPRPPERRGVEQPGSSSGS